MSIFTRHKHGRQKRRRHRRIVLIANPTAGGFRRRTLERILGGLAAQGKNVDLFLTERAGDIEAICSAEKDRADVIAIAGGDGSLNDALRVLADAVLCPNLALIPFGTANVLACELGLPFRATPIVEMIARGRTAPLHYGTASGLPFVLMTSVGFDAEVVHHVSPRLKRRFGKLAYVWTGLTRLSRQRGDAVTVVADGGEAQTCRLAVVTNSRCYGGRFVLCRQASARDPGLYLVTLSAESRLAMVRFALALAGNRISAAHGVSVRPVDSVEFHANTPVPCQMDGDPFGSTPLRVAAGKGAVPILVP